MTTSNHPYHLVEKSPWPIIASMSALLLTTGMVKWFHHFTANLLLMSMLAMTLVSAQWWRDVSREGTLQGLHTLKVSTGLRMGMILFIISEVLFFFSFFWAFFHSSLNPTMELGATWPPSSITPFNPFQIPLLNTAILLASGVAVTWAHHAVVENLHMMSINSLLVTILLGLYFSALQALEYVEAPFTLADSVYGSTFFVATGFHGLHVMIGTTFLAICLLRLHSAHFSKTHHMGLEAAIWYWHFVDVVWLFLYMSIYWWGS
uniref:Cytochrome c oxidase subunit 3 n=1 Tax=Eulimnogammarus verrucosus TaxID=36941 RepID=V5QFI6_EULVE|nr:cytochrome c oxidase subunit III [Eulimnogammarus verrucosus]AHB14319.1 cytochrome c oxidase subunit 3 [Eulimnogammarus verrucosus]